MVGGTIIDIASVKDGLRRVWCIERGGAEGAIYINDPRPVVGDKLWWQGGFAYWTPANGTYPPDTRLKRVGFSFDPRRREAPE